MLGSFGMFDLLMVAVFYMSPVALIVLFVWAIYRLVTRGSRQSARPPIVDRRPRAERVTARLLQVLGSVLIGLWVFSLVLQLMTLDRPPTVPRMGPSLAVAIGCLLCGALLLRYGRPLGAVLTGGPIPGGSRARRASPSGRGA